jgi:hypothetical protein
MADANLDIRVTSKGIKEAHLALQKLGVSADKAEEAVKQYKEETKKNEKTQEQYRKKQKQATNEVSRAAQVHREARGGFRAMRGATQQLSFQLQDVAVQAQSGTAGLTILAQQGPQILSVFGPGGAVVGALVAFGALIGGVLVSAFKDSEEGSDALAAALDRLKSQVDETDNATFQLSKRILEFAKVSEAAAQAELISGLKDTRIALVQTQKDFKALISDSITQDIRDVSQELANLRQNDPFVDGKLIEATGTYSDELGVVNAALDELGLKYGISKKQALAFVDAAAGLDDNKVKTYSNFRAVIDDIQNSQSELRPAFANLRRDIVAQETQLRSLTDQSQLLRRAQRDLREQGVAGLRDLVDPSDAARRARELSLAVQAEIDQREELARLNQRQMFDVLNAELKETERVEKEKAALAEQTQQALSKLYSATSPAVLSFARQQQATLKILEDANERKLLSDEGLARAREQIEEDLTAFILAQQQEREKKEAESQVRALEREAKLAYDRMSLVEKWMLSTQQAIENIDALQMLMAVNFERSLTSAFEGILTGTMTVKEAFVQFTKDMLSSFLGMISEMIAKRLALAAVEKLIGKTTAAASATYLGLTAAATSMQAGLAAYASTAAIPVVGPAAAPAAMAAALGVTGPIAGAISALSGAAAAGRATGGQVRGGQSYLVGERGPELLTMGGSGRISSNDQLKQAVGGGGGITIINNVDARGADASVDQKIRVAMKQTSEATTRNIQNLMKRRRFV